MPPQSRDDGEHGNHSRSRATNLERMTGIVGGLVATAAIVLLVYQAVSTRDSTVDLTVSVTSIESSADHYVVHYKVTNGGGATAESVTVVGEVTRSGSSVQRLSSVLAYVPAHSSRDGTIIFTENPRDGTLTIWAAGYQLP